MATNNDTLNLKNLFIGIVFTAFTSVLAWNFTRVIDNTQKIVELQVHVNALRDIPQRLTVLETTSPTKEQQRELYNLLSQINQRLALIEQKMKDDK